MSAGMQHRDVVATSTAQNAAQLGYDESRNNYNAESKYAGAIRSVMMPEDQQTVSALAGMMIKYNPTGAENTAHSVQAALRDLVLQRLDPLIEEALDCGKATFIGTGPREILKYRARINAQFLIYEGDPTDALRTFHRLNSEIAKRLANDLGERTVLRVIEDVQTAANLDKARLRLRYQDEMEKLRKEKPDDFEAQDFDEFLLAVEQTRISEYHASLGKLCPEPSSRLGVNDRGEASRATARIVFRGVLEALTASVPSGQERISTTRAPRAGTIFLLDCIYNMGDRGLADRLDEAGANTGYATMIVPWEELGIIVKDHDLYELTYDKNGWMRLNIGTGKSYFHKAETWRQAFQSVVITNGRSQFTKEIVFAAGNQLLLKISRTNASGPVGYSLKVPANMRGVRILDVGATYALYRERDVPLHGAPDDRFKPVYTVVPKLVYERMGSYIGGLTPEDVKRNVLHSQLGRTVSGTIYLDGAASGHESCFTSEQYEMMVGNLIARHASKTRLFDEAIVAAKHEDGSLFSVLRKFLKRRWHMVGDFLKFWKTNLGTDIVWAIYTNHHPSWRGEAKPNAKGGRAWYSPKIEVTVPFATYNKSLQCKPASTTPKKHEHNEGCRFCPRYRQYFGLQEYKCGGGKPGSFAEVDWTAAAREDALSSIRSQIAKAESSEADRLRRTLTNYHDAVRAMTVRDCGDEPYRFRISLFTGPAGGGKTYTHRLQMDTYSVNAAPNGALQLEAMTYRHPVTGVPCGSSSATIHKLILSPDKLKMFVDECWTQDLRVLLPSAIKLGVTELVFSGDFNQTHLLPTEGLGLKTCVDYAGLPDDQRAPDAPDGWVRFPKYEDIDIHDSRYSMRIPPNHIEVTNDLFNLTGETRSTVVATHAAYSIDEYLASDDRDTPILSFERETNEIFAERHEGSVRSNQGKEWETIAVYFHSTASVTACNLLRGMGYVGLTRYTKRLILIYNNASEDARAKVKDLDERYTAAENDFEGVQVVVPAVDLGEDSEAIPAMIRFLEEAKERNERATHFGYERHVRGGASYRQTLFTIGGSFGRGGYTPVVSAGSGCLYQAYRVHLQNQGKDYAFTDAQFKTRIQEAMLKEAIADKNFAALQDDNLFNLMLDPTSTECGVRALNYLDDRPHLVLGIRSDGQLDVIERIRCPGLEFKDYDKPLALTINAEVRKANPMTGSGMFYKAPTQTYLETAERQVPVMVWLYGDGHYEAMIHKPSYTVTSEADELARAVRAYQGRPDKPVLPPAAVRLLASDVRMVPAPVPERELPPPGQRACRGLIRECEGHAELGEGPKKPCPGHIEYCAGHAPDDEPFLPSSCREGEAQGTRPVVAPLGRPAPPAPVAKPAQISEHVNDPAHEADLSNEAPADLPAPALLGNGFAGHMPSGYTRQERRYHAKPRAARQYFDCSDFGLFAQGAATFTPMRPGKTLPAPGLFRPRTFLPKRPRGVLKMVIRSLVKRDDSVYLANGVHNFDGEAVGNIHLPGNHHRIRMTSDLALGVLKTRKGRIRDDEPAVRCFAVQGNSVTRSGGNPNHMTNTLLSRYVKRKHERSLRVEQMALVKKMWQNLLDGGFYKPREQHIMIDRDRMGETTDRALSDMRERRYESRARGEAYTRPKNALFTNMKAQDKVSTSGKVDHLKAGQGIMAASAEKNAYYMMLFRELTNVEIENRADETCAAPVLSEHQEDSSSFEARGSRLLRALDDCARTIGFDVSQMDSSQSLATQWIERMRAEHFGLFGPFMDAYWDQRENVEITGSGFKAKAGTVKCTGEVGTLVGNELICAAIAEYIIRRTAGSPAVKFLKGDDYAIRGVSIWVDKERQREVERVLGFKVKLDEGNCINWCAYIVAPTGLRPNVRRRVAKMINQKFRSAEHFMEYQASLVDYLETTLRYSMAELAAAEHALLLSDGHQRSHEFAAGRVQDWLSAMREVALMDHDEFMSQSNLMAATGYLNIQGDPKGPCVRAVGRRTHDDGTGPKWDRPVVTDSKPRLVRAQTWKLTELDDH